MSILISGYTLLETLYESNNTLIVRALQPSGQSAIVKTLKTEHPSLESLACLKHEHGVLQALQIEGVPQAIALESYHNGLALILSDLEGKTLKQVLKQGPLDLQTALEITIQLAAILADLHQQQITHNAIQPPTILFQAETKQVQLIDFSLSSRLSQEPQAVNLPEVALLYISPEQTGRMNRSIDYRTDFYSLGVTFYEMLTGQVPYDATDPLELIHCHIAKTPASPKELDPALPTTVSDIVMKLMAKTAEDRYQSALGLKADLETCLRKLQSFGEVSHFAVGDLDLSSQFLIPQKLYGRHQEVEQLMAAFTRVGSGRTEMLLVSGYSGVGKSSLVNEIHQSIGALHHSVETTQRGYFISGKFDQFKRNIPYAALIQACQELVRQLLTESVQRVANWQAKLLNALGGNGQVIIDVIPEVEEIIGPQPAVSNLGAIESQNRFNRTFQQFIHVFSQPGHPLVLFLDDLQWADAASLKLIELLITDLDSRHLLLIGAYRDHEVSSAHSLMLTLETIRKTSAIVGDIVLQPLNVAHVTQLIQDTLHSDSHRVQPLAELVFQKTQGNPFFLTQLLKSLHQEKLLTFDFAQKCWQWDLNHLQDISITENVIDLMVKQIRKLSPVAQQVLKLAACIGDKFTLNVLAIVNEQSQSLTATQLWEILQVGFVLPLDQSYKIPLLEDPDRFHEPTKVITYRFLHDRVQQAAYSLIPDSQKQETHLKIGQLLLRNTPPEQREENIFALVNQLNYGIDLVTSASERHQLAELNLIAGQRAKAAAAYESAIRYLKRGLKLLAANSWHEQYSFTLTLYDLAVEAAYLNGDFEQMEQWATLVLQQAKSSIDKMKVYGIKMQACMAQVKQLEAVKIGLEALELLGIKLPELPSASDIQQTLMQTATNLAGKQIEDLTDLPSMTEVDKLAAMQMLISMGSPTYQAAPTLFPLVVCEQVNLSIRYGNSPFSAYGYVCYGVILNSLVGDIESAYQFGQLALDLVDRFHVSELQTSVFFVAGSCTIHGKVHAEETLPLLLNGYQSGLETGSFEYGGYAAQQRCQHAYLIGQELTKLAPEMAAVSEVLAQLKQENTLSWNQIFQQAVLNLVQPSESACCLQGEVYSEETALPLLKQANDRTGLHYFYLNKLILCYLLGEPAQALENAVQAEQYLDGVKAFLVVPVFHFYDSLARLANCEPGSPSNSEHLSQVARNQAKMQQWASHAPMNFQHKYELVAAEQARVLGQYWQAIEHYDRAIAGARAQRYIQEEALASELAATFFLNNGKDRIARDYLNQSYYAYAQWGAVAKTKALKMRYPQVFPSSPQTDLNGQSSVQSMTSTWDLATVIKAAQALSSEIVLDKLLNKLMRMVLKTAGAETGYLILETAGQLKIEARGTIADGDILQQSQMIADDSLPASVINYVVRTQKPIVLADAAIDPVFASDRYMVAQRPRSVLCTPILYQGKLTGLLYLENNLISGAFTPDRLEVLQLLSSQAAIAIENAHLYQGLAAANRNLEAKVAERTLELQAKNSHLQQEIRERQRAEEAAQSANAAKSEFLANMSHELRTPLNGILGYTQILKKTTTLTEQQQNGLDIIHQSGEHLLTLINDILDLSKIEARKMELHPEEFYLPGFLDNLVKICKVRACPEITFSYEPIAPLPAYVYADEKRLRQVLLNLLGNAIKFTERGWINFQVRVISGSKALPTIRFRIQDTGIGISNHQLEEIFLPFQQVGVERRKPEGTGLGLAISRQLVQMMGSEIQVQSAPGQGSCFWFDVTLPEVASENAIQGHSQGATVPRQPNIVGYQGDRRRVLIVDNRRENRAVLLGLLKPLGFETFEASDGQDGLDKAQTLRPDIILMDLVMPVVDGFEAIRRLRASPNLKDIMIIAISASVLDYNQATSRKAGCNSFLPKPVREVDLLQHLQSHLQLEWIYETPESEQQNDDAASSFKELLHIDLISAVACLPPPPSRSALDTLFNLGMQGDLQGIVKYITQLEQIDDRWVPFTRHLRQLAKAFEEQQMLELIRQYRQL